MSPREREELIVNHLPRVHWVAARICDKLCWDASFEDLVSVGVIGLIAAVDRYDPSYGVRLQTYADYKIRGAILDGMRGSAWISARRRGAAKRLRLALAALEQRLCRPAGEEEAAEELGMSLDAYRKAAYAARAVRVQSLDAVWDGGEDGVPLRDLLADGESSLPSWALERAELRRVIAAGIEVLPEAQRLAIRKYYLEGKALREIAEDLHVHVTRVSQLKIQAVARLRAYVQKSWCGRKDEIGNAGEERKRQTALMAS
jgi:RNA polymerase sigma factor FliA